MEYGKAAHRLCIQGMLACITLYQHTLSPDHGPFKAVYGGRVCRFTPTCSEYMAQCIRKDGFGGIWNGLKQIIRCNPFI